MDPHASHLVPRSRGGGLAAAVIALLLVAASAPAQVTVSIPDTAAARGTAVTIPVRLADPAPDGIVAVEVAIAFDGDALSYQGLSAAGTLTEHWLVDSVLVEAGVVDTLRMLAATATDTAANGGDLFRLSFLVADRRDSTTAAVVLTSALLNDGAPAATASGGSVTVTGTNGVIAAEPDSALPGQAVQVTIADVDEDRTGGIDVVPVVVVNGAQVETLTASETGSTTGLFDLTVPLVASVSQPSGDGIVQVQAGDQLSVCYDDVLDGAGGAVQRCDAVEIAGATVGTDGVVVATVVVAPGDTAWVRVSDADLNADAGEVEEAPVLARNLATGEEAAVDLTETGADTGIFIGRLLTAFGTVAGAAGDDLVLVQKGDTVRVDFSDYATASGSTETRSADIVVVDPFGDASGNGTVRGYDAALILDHSVGAITLAGLDSLAANLDIQAPAGPITAFDASLVLQYRVGLLVSFPVRDRGSANHPQPETSGAPRPVAAARTLALRATESGDWALVLDERAGVVSVDVVIAGLQGRAVTSPQAAGFAVASQQTAVGLRVAAAAAAGVDGPGELLRLEPASDETEAQVVSARLNDGQVPVALAPVATAAAPRRLRLLPNHPNPFNPETAIRFETARDAHVYVDILNPLGQRVRRLSQEWRPAGPHQLIWDGRDDAGAVLAGGIYFYRVATPDERAVGKMTLVK